MSLETEAFLIASSLITDRPAACSSSSLAALTTMVSSSTEGIACWSATSCAAICCALRSSISAANAAVFKIEAIAMPSRALPVTKRNGFSV